MAIRSYLETQYLLSGNPFSGQATYNEEGQQVYVPEMFGPQRDEFLRKFVLAPLENGQPLIGAVWSIVPGDPKARGFGKSTLMGEEAKRINADFGLATLNALGIDDEEARKHPVLAGYVSFNAKAQGGIANIDSAAFHLVRFMLRSMSLDGTPMHTRLRERAAAVLVASGGAIAGQETDAIVEAVRAKFRALAVAIDIRNLLEEFVYHLAAPDSALLDRFLGDAVGTWHHDRNGLKYLQLFTAFSELAGVKHLSLFVDQVEDFTAFAGQVKIVKNVKIIRDALIETEPFKSRASFIFQLHPGAWSRLRDAWSQEDLRSLDATNPLNAPFVVVLKGLETFDSARLLAERCLNHKSFALPGRKDPIMPFTEESLRRVWERTRPKPRDYLRVLHDLLVLGKDQRQAVLDEAFVLPNLQNLGQTAVEVDEEEHTDDRLA
jgi:hypothetical protein